MIDLIGLQANLGARAVPDDNGKYVVYICLRKMRVDVDDACSVFPKHATPPE